MKKSESKEKEEQNISKLKNNQVKKNNYFKSISSTFQKKDENKYMDSSYVSNESFDNSNKHINNNINQKRLDSIDLLKEKNIQNNNDINSNINDDKTKNIQQKKKIININNNINVTPKKQKSTQFKEDVEGNKIKGKKKKSLVQTINPENDLSNVNEILKIQKLNKEMVNKSNYFEKEFSFFYCIFCALFKNKRKDDIKNLYSLISFRKKILSENFIFNQHIINILLGKKCGIKPHEIKYLI